MVCRLVPVNFWFILDGLQDELRWYVCQYMIMLFSNLAKVLVLSYKFFLVEVNSFFLLAIHMDLDNPVNVLKLDMKPLLNNACKMRSDTILHEYEVIVVVPSGNRGRTPCSNDQHS